MEVTSYLQWGTGDGSTWWALLVGNGGMALRLLLPPLHRSAWLTPLLWIRELTPSRIKRVAMKIRRGLINSLKVGWLYSHWQFLSLTEIEWRTNFGTSLPFKSNVTCCLDIYSSHEKSPVSNELRLSPWSRIIGECCVRKILGFRLPCRVAAVGMRQTGFFRAGDI